MDKRAGLTKIFITAISSDKHIRDYTIADWAKEYRCFVSRRKRLGLWPCPEEERKSAWESHKIFGIYKCGNSLYMTVKEFISKLSDCPEEAKVIFNDDDNYRVLQLGSIDNENIEEMPESCDSPAPGKVAFIHLSEELSPLKKAVRKSCTTDCARYAAGTCPFSYSERGMCYRVKQFLNEDE